MMPKNLIELFNDSLARATPNKVFLEIVRTEREEKLTFGELERKTWEFAIYLIKDKSIQIGDKVAILGKNRKDWDIALWGIILAGAIPVLIDPERKIDGVKKHLFNTDAKLIVVANDYQDYKSRRELNQYIDSIEMTVYPKINLDELKIVKRLHSIFNQIKTDDTAVILCTSGATGTPKEIELTHRNLISNIEGTLQIVKVDSEDKLCHIVPPHHSFGFTVTKLLALWIGGTNIYTDRYRQIPQLIKNKKATIFLAIPSVFTILAKKFEKELAKMKEKSLLIRFADCYFPKLVGKMIIRKNGWKNLRFFLSGSAPLPKWALNTFWKRGLQLWEGYGLTENGPIYGFNNNPKKLGSVGKPIPTMLIKIANEQNQVLSAGQKGEIILGGPCIMKGYYKSSDTQKVIKTGANGIRWLYTGDIGYLDEDGYLFITGRKKYLIVLPNGKNVSPEMLELALSQACYIEELLIVPSHKDTGEETIKIIVRPDFEEIKTNTGLLRDDLVNQPQSLKKLIWQSINKCQQQNQELSPFERITNSNSLEIKLDEFVKTPTGKIKRDVYM